MVNGEWNGGNRLAADWKERDAPASAPLPRGTLH